MASWLFSKAQTLVESQKNNAEKEGRDISTSRALFGGLAASVSAARSRAANSSIVARVREKANQAIDSVVERAERAAGVQELSEQVKPLLQYHKTIKKSCNQPTRGHYQWS